MSNTLQLTEQLIAEVSVTPEDANCQAILGERLRALGFECESMPSGPETFRVKNMFALKKTNTPMGEDAPVLLFAGHTDVVPTGPLKNWSSDPFTPSHRAGKLYGRGTSDMKSSLAAMVVACEEFLALESSPAFAMSFLLTSDEEGPATDGTVVVCNTLKARGQRLDWCIVGEPTGMQVVVAHKGKHAYKTSVRGFEAHSSLTPLGVNAVEIACEFVTHLKGMHRRLVASGPFDPIYDVPHTTIHTGVINGGTALNIIPRDCEILWEIRHHHLDRPEDLFAQARAFSDSLLPAMQSVSPDTGISHELRSVLPGFVTGVDSDIARLCFDCAGADPSSGAGKVSFGTEASLFHQAGVPTIVCGPGHIAQAHQPNEWVSLEQLAWCERFMRRLAERICLS